MPDLVNPLAAYRDAYSLLEGQAQDRTRRQAGNALAGGDYQGAQSALYGRGMLQEGQQVGQMQQGMQDRQAAQQTAQAEEEKKAALERLGVLGNATQALRRLPAEQRAQLLQTQIMPILSQMPGFDEQMLQQVMQSDLSDQSLDAFGALLGQEAQKLQLFNTRNGVVGVDPQSGDSRMLYEAPPEPPSAPTGYRMLPDGNMEYIPGGPADPRVVGTRAAAGRAPPRARASGGGSAPKPPPGFILDGQ